MSQLPVLLSIPHGGKMIPPILRERVCITDIDLHDDSDAFTQEIYNLNDKVMAVVQCEVARAFVDMNRAPDDRPPANPDGVVKSMTCLRQPIYCDGWYPDEATTPELLQLYHEPYHQQIRTALQLAGLELALDCHSMLPYGPNIGPDSGQRRPLVCLGNVHGQTCSMENLKKMARCFQVAFDLPEEEILLNVPFSGGYITRTYGISTQPVPWIQIELNRALYLEPPLFDRATLTIDHGRLAELNIRFEQVLRLFFA
jgi:formiminoglutamase